MRYLFSILLISQALTFDLQAVTPKILLDNTLQKKTLIAIDDRDTLDLYERNRQNIRRERRFNQYKNRQRGMNLYREYYPPGKYVEGDQSGQNNGNRNNDYRSRDRINWPNNMPPGQEQPYFWERP